MFKLLLTRSLTLLTRNAISLLPCQAFPIPIESYHSILFHSRDYATLLLAWSCTFVDNKIRRKIERVMSQSRKKLAGCLRPIKMDKFSFSFSFLFFLFLVSFFSLATCNWCTQKKIMTLCMQNYIISSIRKNAFTHIYVDREYT